MSGYRLCVIKEALCIYEISLSISDIFSAAQ